MIIRMAQSMLHRDTVVVDVMLVHRVCVATSWVPVVLANRNQGATHYLHWWSCLLKPGGAALVRVVQVTFDDAQVLVHELSNRKAIVNSIKFRVVPFLASLHCSVEGGVVCSELHLDQANNVFPLMVLRIISPIWWVR